jgi:hypothetical protein
VPDGLTGSTGPTTDPWAEPPAPPGGIAAVVRQAVWVLVLFAVVGAASGVAWYLLWTPATGVVVGHHWYPSETGLRRDFGGTGWYVTVAAVIGLCLGISSAWVFDRSELATLFAVCVGSVLAAWLMYQVGEHLGPPDPVATAKHTADNKTIKGDLRVRGSTPWLSFPTGALLGLGAVYFSTSGKPSANSG